ncbi:unnamed protein product [Euphydryas editha]|uniref:Uncharacterized protein n=1 Tax=Euphydryas editha TaxID=104508 RepID=A0AAU9UVQ9_EUPED|nr:unnamed protein product [Euphydryas editha]
MGATTSHGLPARASALAAARTLRTDISTAHNRPQARCLSLCFSLTPSSLRRLPQSPSFTFARSRTRRDTSLIAAAAEPDLLSPVDIAAVMELERRRTEIKCK